MKTSRFFTLILSIFTMVQVVFGADEEVDPNLKAGQLALRSKEYKVAVVALDKVIAAKKERVDEAVYLKALAQYYDKQYDACITTCDKLAADHKDSSWRYKGRFLKAGAFVQKRDYKSAETIYAAESKRLLSAVRKQDVAGVIIHFADALATKRDKDDLKAPPPNFQKAYSLYNKALAMEISRELRDEVTFKKARAIQQANNAGQATNDFRAYLQEFDPDWLGNVDSPQRASGLKKENPEPAGKHLFTARFHLAEAQHQARRMREVRVNLEDLLQLIKEKNAVDEQAQLIADARWLIVQAYRLPNPQSNELELGIKAARDFLAKHANDPRSVYGAWWIAKTYQQHGRSDDAIAAFEDFLAKKGHQLPKGEGLTTPIPGLGGTPAKLQSDWEKDGLFQIAQIRFGQKKYEEATKAWQSYVNKYPDGPHWANCQRGIINAQYQIAMDAVEAKEYAKGRRLFEAFLAANPLDSRAGQVLFLFGQIAYQDAVELEKKQDDPEVPAEEKDTEKEIKEAYSKAIAQWQRLVSKYPGTEEASVALYRIGLIQEEKLGDWKTALASYRRLQWGSKAGSARGRVGLMTKATLALHTERTFHSNQKPTVKLTTRNIKKVTVKQYFLDLEAYFRKRHLIGNIDHLDIALIEPDKSWDVEVEDYTDYRPTEQQIEIPFEGEKSGVCLVNVSDDNFEATTLVIRSDLDVILKSSRREALVFVENRRTGKPAAGVKVLLSDGKKVFGSGETEKDGVFRKKFDDLKSIGDLRVFAIDKGHVASNLIGLGGLQFGTGLAAKGYLYTDRPAYQPGETIKLRGIIRDVKEGSYVAPEGKTYLVSVKDAAGRLIWEVEQKLGKFGSFHSSLRLDPRAPLGNYTLTAREKENPKQAYSSVFTVQRFQLEKIRLKLEADQTVYFRGETVELEIQAEYYWGQPVSEKQISYYLPDGRMLIGKTDADGKLKVEYDTTGSQPGTSLLFRVSIDGENVKGEHRVFLAREGFTATLKPSQPLALSGEPFDVTVTTQSPDGKPAGKELVLFVLQRQAAKPNPILRAIPWTSRSHRQIEETTVQEHKVTTDEKTGKATVRITLKQGGAYVLRATGEDRFKQTVTAESMVSISDEEDATKLRFFAQSDTLQVGSTAKLRLHSRLASGLALLTFEGEEILEHRVLTLKKDFNEINLEVDHVHFPNFNVCVNALDGRELRIAQKAFTVERQLNLTVKPKQEVYGPGAEAEVEIEVTDQLGKPVEGELSLALVDEAIYSLFPDGTPPIREFFQKDARRHAAFRVSSSAGFAYPAITRKVIKEFLDEQARLDRRKEEDKRIALATRQLGDRQMALTGAEILEEMAPGGGSQQAAQEMDLNGNLPVAGFLSNGRTISIGGGTNFSLGPSQSLQPGNSSRSGISGQKADFFFKKQTGHARFAANLNDFEDEKEGQRAGGDQAIRRELAGAGHWLPAVVTNAEGKATVKFVLPSSASEWRLTARGVTVKTLVGQTTGKVITRKDFFVSLKAPGQLQEGDSLRVLGRVHNLTDYEGEVNLNLKLLGGEKFENLLAERKATLKINKQGGSEALFDAIEIPLAANVRLILTATAGDKHQDTLARTFPVRPWGLEYADHEGGVAKGDATAIVSLPADRRDGSQWMTITVGPSLKQSVIDMALGNAVTPWAEGGQNRNYWISPPTRIGGFTGSDLLASVAALEFARKAKAGPVELNRLGNRARTLVGSLVVSQRSDGGWVWRVKDVGSHWGVSATSFWALCTARDAGIPVHADTINKAQSYLRTRFTQLNANDNDAKAVLLHALSVNKAAEFAHANRLHRERNTLSAPALAYVALAFMNLDRKEFAAELLDVLALKLVEKKVGEKSLLHAPGVRNNSWTSEETETAALAALAFMRARPAAAQIQGLVDFLLNRRGAYGFAAAKARGPAVAALAEFYAQGKFAEDDYELTILVNGKAFHVLKVSGNSKSFSLAVPTALLNQGDNSVDFRLNGRGEYAYAVTLRGFSKNLKDPKSWAYPYVHSRLYYHMPLRYRGRSIGVTSSTQVKNIEIGQRVRVHVDLSHYSSTRDFRGYKVIEEHLPAGMMLVDGSLSGSHKHHEIDGNKITMYFPTGQSTNDFSYHLIGYASGEYRALPTVIRDVVDTGRMRIGLAATLKVLAPGEKSADVYAMNDSERYKLGELNFNDGNYDEALKYLAALRSKNPRHNEQQVCRMLLWIYTSPGRYDAKQIITVFEVLRERYPTLEIPFDKILVVGKAYRDLGEFERAYLVFKATIDASFINDVNISAVLEDEGQFLGSIDYQEDLWREYPDTAEVGSMYFSISQALYLKAPKAHELAKLERNVAIMRGGKPVRQDQHKPERIAMLRETIRLLASFMTLNPENPLADDAAFSMANALLDLKQYDLVIGTCGQFKTRFPESDFTSGYQYMVALGHFWKHNHPDALKAAAVVAEGDSKDKNFAEYIIGQIHHAEGDPAKAIEWYRKVKEKYPDAKQSIDYFEEKRIKLEEVNVFRPGKPVELNLKYRNVKEAYLQVYPVDLMKLYLREKNLSKITQVSLAGIAPLLEATVELGDGKDYIDKEKTAKLALKKDGAYLVICRGDDLFTSALILVTPLKIEVQEDVTSGRVRANLRDVTADKYVAGVHVKAIGSSDNSFKSGETDLRGIFVADALNGSATVIARDEQNRYAFYRGKTPLGKAVPRPQSSPQPKVPQKGGKLYYQQNLHMQNESIQNLNWGGYDSFRRGSNKGVQIQQVK
jgi:alpha-2-macroglobulin